MKSFNYNFSLFKEHNIYVEYYAGNINANNLLAFKDYHTNNENYDSNKSIIMDFRKATLNLLPSDIQKLKNFILSNDHVIGQRKIALITSTPNQVVFTTIFQKSLDGFPMKYKVVSTIAAACKWIEIPIHCEKKIGSILSKLEQSPNQQLKQF